MNNFTITIFCILFTLNAFCQVTFELLIQSPNYDAPNDLLIDNDGNYVIVGSSFDLNTNFSSGIAIKINPFGEVIKNYTFSYPDTSCNFFKIVNLDSNYLVFGGIGPGEIGLSSVLIYSFDFDFNLLWRKTYKISDIHTLGDFKAKIDLDGNIVMMGMAVKEVNYLDTDPFEFRCNPSGDSISMLVESLDNHQRVFDFLIKPDSSGYITFGSGQYPTYPNIDANAAYYNQSFLREKVREVPNDIYWSHTVCWINDEEFFISGNKHIPSPLSIHPVGFMRLDTAFNIIDDVHFGVFPDTSCYPGWMRSFDYLDLNKIFFTWTKNFDDFFQGMPSWIVLTKFDSSLNTVYERYYGGDVMYSAYHVRSTDDGGCIISGIRYDYNNQDYNYDLYLIKTDENGLVTSVNENHVAGETNITVYPNPCTDRISFDRDLQLIEIYDSGGKLILRYENYTQSSPIYVDYLKPGLYVYLAIDNTGIFSSRKLVKM